MDRVLPGCVSCGSTRYLVECTHADCLGLRSFRRDRDQVVLEGKQHQLPLRLTHDSSFLNLKLKLQCQLSNASIDGRATDDAERG